MPLTRGAERAQAELFAAMLNEESAALKAVMAKAEAKWRMRRRYEDDVEPPDRLSVVQERVEEIDRMLSALSERFSTESAAAAPRRTRP